MKKNNDDVQELDFERAFGRLEEIIKLLEDESISLDESIELFKEGVKLYKYCKSKLDNARLVVRDVMKELEKEIETQSNDLQREEGGFEDDDSERTL
ncbi:MAG: exodeoxyribonuclease VII small subunit [Thermotogae bacterium]|nr:exodeoxyribonuclease VII small subunit [Thermotogota bacterium]